MTAGQGRPTDRAELVSRAQARGVAVSYQDWRGREVEVGADTLEAILDALGDPGPDAPPKAGRRAAIQHVPGSRWEPLPKPAAAEGVSDVGTSDGTNRFR